MKTLSLAILLSLGSAFSPLLTHAQDLIVAFRQTSRSNALETLRSIGAGRTEAIVGRLGLVKIHLSNESRSTRDPREILRILRQNPNVRYAFFDRPIVKRRADAFASAESANEPTKAPLDYFDRTQWNLKARNLVSSQAENVWREFQVHSKTWQKKEVVAAVVDGGFDLNHPNLKHAFWKNKNEIPGNGIDDDQNGYVDDVMGWNAYNDSPRLPIDDHGTHVSGIIGALPSKTQKIYGIYPSVKVLPVAGASGNTSIILKAYGYILDQKRLYLSSKGQRGANVVVVNSSFGVDMADCKSEEFKAWNEIYNEMGSLGILNVVATTNQDLNVDEAGDVPSTCESPFLTVVGRIYQDSHQEGGYGRKNVDIHAPGDNIYSTVSGGKIAPMTGTSMASPHVTGAIAYLYWIFESMLPIETPDRVQKAPLYIKGLLLQAARHQQNLAGLTASGSTLDLYQAASLLVDRFESNSIQASKVVKREVPLRSI